MRQEKASYQRWVSILILLLLVALIGFVVSGCSGGAEEEKEGTATEKAESTSEEHGEESEEEVSDPGILYTNNCGACHGHDGSGVVGPAIKGTPLTVAQIEGKINNGGQEMPKFKGGELKEEQIKIIADYVKNDLK